MDTLFQILETREGAINIYLSTSVPGSQGYHPITASIENRNCQLTILVKTGLQQTKTYLFTIGLNSN